MAIFACNLTQHRSGEWKYEFKMSKLTTTILNLLFTEAEQTGKTRRHFRRYIGPGSDVSSTDKLSLDLRSNPWTLQFLFDLATCTNLGLPSRRMRGSMTSRRFGIDQYAV